MERGGTQGGRGGILGRGGSQSPPGGGKEDCKKKTGDWDTAPGGETGKGVKNRVTKKSHVSKMQTSYLGNSRRSKRKEREGKEVIRTSKNKGKARRKKIRSDAVCRDVKPEKRGETSVKKKRVGERKPVSPCQKKKPDNYRSGKGARIERRK